MKFLASLERRLQPYAVPNITLWLVVGQAFVFFADMMPRGGLYEHVVLVPALVLKGEVWRLFTYPLTPPLMSPFWFLIYIVAFYYFGTAVESIWGTVRYNFYLIIGFLLTAAASFAAPNWPVNGAFVKTSVFLAYAALLPDAVIHVSMIFPVKARYLAALTWALYGYAVYVGPFSQRLMILAAVSNFFLFFGMSAFSTFKHARRRRQFQKKVERGKAAMVHECRVCGITSEMAPRLTFRYCSKCAGSCCYCPEHLKDHECVKEES